MYNDIINFSFNHISKVIYFLYNIAYVCTSAILCLNISFPEWCLYDTFLIMAWENFLYDSNLPKQYSTASVKPLVKKPHIL